MSFPRSLFGRNKSKPPVLIGLYSPLNGSGKTTTANLLVDAIAARRGHRAFLRPFAAPIKLASAAFLEAVGLTDVEATRCIYERKDHAIAGLGELKGREVQVEIGTYAREKIRPTIWIERNEVQIRRDLQAGFSVIVDDVRMENEAEAIMRLGGSMVKISRGDSPLVIKATEGRLENLQFDAIFSNTGTLRDLEGMCLKFVGGLP